ncbi:MAG: hypothetical protein H6975_04240 [Gammaproteobacteria bacterium]|nr:hypothetical protein [Gammaproteobacteria bacterium]
MNYEKEIENLEIGSLFYGKIYPNRCDLSPDGTYFIYFAMGKSQKQYDKRLYCWTGVCVPPNIKAIKLFAHKDTWGGGGRFINDNTIYISPGQYPDFDKNLNDQLDKYKITFTGNIEDGGWTSGNGWKILKRQIVQELGDKYPIPKIWTKTNGEITLLKYLNYNSYLKRMDGQVMGDYDLHSYAVQDNKNEVKFPLNDKEKICKWADFDNTGRLIVAKESKIFIYQNLENINSKRPSKIYDFENFIDLPK